MGFLDNSGDIILDAVLTDLGRKRLAEGNGSFKISKFALGDDEIDYGLYDKNHASGSAYYDINILQAPVLEAFTNNMSSMKSRLLSYSENDLLYLPVILVKTSGESDFYTGLSSYIVLVDDATVDSLTDASNALTTGVLNGFKPGQGSNLVRADQGLNTIDLSPDMTLAEYNSSLVETQFFIQVDNRLGIVRPKGKGGSDVSVFSPVSIDDDSIATYIFSDSDDSSVVTRLGANADSSLLGPRGTRVEFKIGASLDLRTSVFLFDQLGSAGTSNIVSGTKTLAAADYKFIDSTVRVSGISTGYTLDVPVRFVKKN
tara:strand:- start:2343 stop:3287 length:945 start_codon:yes stop_codon:yes gene_type:complete